MKRDSCSGRGRCVATAQEPPGLGLTLREGSSRIVAATCRLDSDPGEYSDDEEISVRAGTCGMLIAAAGDAGGYVCAAAGGRATGRGDRAADSGSEHRARGEEDHGVAEIGGGLAGSNQHAGRRARACGFGRRIGVERGIGIVDAHREARRGGAADAAGIDVWEIALAGDEDCEAGWEI